MATGNLDKSINIDDFRLFSKDTGSAEVQVAQITERVRVLTTHFKVHKKDFHSQTGLTKMISRRRKLLTFLKASQPINYQSLIQKLGLRK